MPQEIYNEGRVVGLSAWELFLRTALENGVDPQDVPNEQQWLTSMIGMGSSMILKIPANTAKGVHDFELPTNSNLAGAGVIIANPFLGDCEWDSSTWATKVVSYSPLIQNTSTTYPSSSTVPYDNTYSNDTYKNCVSEFVKITDGIVYVKNANWVNTETGTPYKDINPNFNESTSVVRLYICSDTRYEIRILLTGFLNKRILQGISGYAKETYEGGSADVTNNDWINGGMLGPEIFPWASKIVFTVPSSAYNLANSLSRTIPSDTTYTAKKVGGIEFKNVSATVKTNSLIDIDSINLPDYYTVHATDFVGSPTLQENITDLALGISDSYSTVVAWYPGMTANKIKAATDNSQIFPPALYGAQVTTQGTKTLVPLDTAAPGTVKGFSNSTQAYNYTQIMPDNYAVYNNVTEGTFAFVNRNDSNPANWTGTAKITYLTGNYPRVEISAGNKKTKTIALTDSSNQDYDVSGSSSNITLGPSNNLNWDSLLKALKNNQSLDILGQRLHYFGEELNSNNKIGTTANNPVAEVKSTTVTTDSVTFKSGTTASINVTSAYQSADTTKYVTLPSDSSIQIGKNFIKFGNGLKLFIQTSEPSTAGVEVGSIGIGW